MKKSFVFTVITILFSLLSGGLGYVAAYVQGLQRANEMYVRAYCDVLNVESVSMLNVSDINCLINKIKLNCDSWASLIRVNKPYVSTDTKKDITKALEAWKETKVKLQKIIDRHGGNLTKKREKPVGSKVDQFRPMKDLDEIP